MAELEYSLSELHNLFELGLRNSMCINEKSDMHEVAVENRDYILGEGNPVKNKMYKNMKIMSELQQDLLLLLRQLL
mgnify:CR=1 FL=1